jgi:hypothetical protein
MSVRLLPRELGAVLECDGCDARFQTGQILRRSIRAAAKAVGWFRGGRREGTKVVKKPDGPSIILPCVKWSKAPDMCPECKLPELAYLADLAAKRTERSRKRAAESKQRLAAQLEQERAAAQGASVNP